jgi:hypothetical protein
MVDADAVVLKTFTYSEPYEWGFALMPGHYNFRVPYLKQQCGAYARQNVYQYPKFY